MSKYNGWMKVGMDGEWFVICSAEERRFWVEETVQKLRPEGKFSEILVLPEPETPYERIKWRSK